MLSVNAAKNPLRVLISWDAAQAMKVNLLDEYPILNPFYCFVAYYVCDQPTPC